MVAVVLQMVTVMLSMVKFSFSVVTVLERDFRYIFLSSFAPIAFYTSFKILKHIGEGT